MVNHIPEGVEDEYKFSLPYENETLIAESGLLLTSLQDVASTSINPLLTSLLKWIAGHVTSYAVFSAPSK